MRCSEFFSFSRKKNIFKLAQGEYIAPEKIENSYIRSQFISQCFIYGIPFALKDFLKNADYVLDIISIAFVESTISQAYK